MRALLFWMLGVPLTGETRARALRNVLGDRQGDQASEFMFQGIIHNTVKAGALLTAQGMFAVFATYALDHGWPKAPVLPAILLLLTGALLAMTILRSTIGSFREVSAPTKDPVHQMFDLVLSRMIRFNLALYMTFLSVILLLVAALAMV
jgi:hypothetical protein